MRKTQYLGAGLEEDRQQTQQIWRLTDIFERPVNRLLIVTGRLPLKMRAGGDAGLEVSPHPKGLVGNLSSALPNKTCLWVGWPGSAPDILRDGHLDRAGDEIGCTFKPVVLSRFTIPESDFDDYYLGFSNKVLRPLFQGSPQIGRSDSGYWYTYQEFNRKFACRLAEISDSDDIILVQDFQLILLAKKLGSIGTKRKTGILLNTPFPSPNILASSQWQTEIIEALLNYDLVGFQTEPDKENFLRCTEKTTGLDYTDKGKLTVISNLRNQTVAGVFAV